MRERGTAGHAERNRAGIAVFGVMVTLEVPALPEATVTLLAERVKLLEALVTVTVNEPLEEA